MDKIHREESTKTLYETNYARIVEYLGASFTLNDLKQHIEGLKSNTQISYVQSIVITQHLTSGDIFDYFIELKKNNDNRLSGKESDFNWEDFKNTYEGMKPNTLNYVIMSLYYHLPPLRQGEYVLTKLKKQKGFNFYNPTLSQFVMTESKTKRGYPLRIINIPKKLNDILIEWTRTHNSDYMFGKALTSAGISQRLNRILGSNVSVDILRRTYISSNVPSMTLSERKELARIMGHSLSSQMLIYDENMKQDTILKY